MSDTDDKLRRLMARGYCEVSPAHQGVAVTWAPHGQAGPTGPARWNPMCTRSVVRDTLTEALDALLTVTAPPWHSITDLVERRITAVNELFHVMAGKAWCDSYEEYTLGGLRWLRYCQAGAPHDGDHVYFTREHADA